MSHFNRKPGTKSVILDLKKPFPDITAFDAVIYSLVMKNPLGCTSYMTGKKNHRPVEKVREMYTAKFVYEDPDGKRIGSGTDMYDSVEGYERGVAAVISNMANIAAHRGKVRHIPGSDHYSVIMKCHDPNGELYFLSLARDRVTLSSFTDEKIRERVEQWTDTVPELVPRRAKKSNTPDIE